MAPNMSLCLWQGTLGTKEQRPYLHRSLLLGNDERRWQCYRLGRGPGLHLLGMEQWGKGQWFSVPFSRTACSRSCYSGDHIQFLISDHCTGGFAVTKLRCYTTEWIEHGLVPGLNAKWPREARESHHVYFHTDHHSGKVMTMFITLLVLSEYLQIYKLRGHRCGGRGSIL